MEESDWLLVQPDGDDGDEAQEADNAQVKSAAAPSLPAVMCDPAQGQGKEQQPCPDRQVTLESSHEVLATGGSTAGAPLQAEQMQQEVPAAVSATEGEGDRSAVEVEAKQPEQEPQDTQQMLSGELQLQQLSERQQQLQEQEEEQVQADDQEHTQLAKPGDDVKEEEEKVQVQADEKGGQEPQEQAELEGQEEQEQQAAGQQEAAVEQEVQQGEQQGSESEQRATGSKAGAPAHIPACTHPWPAWLAFLLGPACIVSACPDDSHDAPGGSHGDMSAWLSFAGEALGSVMEEVREDCAELAALLKQAVHAGHGAAAQHARVLRVRLRKALRGHAPSWALISLSAVTTVALVAVGTLLVANHRLANQIKQRDKELARLVLRVLNMQELLQSSRAAVPVLRLTTMQPAFAGLG